MVFAMVSALDEPAAIDVGLLRGGGGKGMSGGSAVVSGWWMGKF
jgi:hypothetical protein